MKIVSLNIGTPKPLEHRGTMVSSAIARTPVSRALWLGLEGFEGDAVADTKNHGGPHKAVNVYPSEHYVFWEAFLKRPVPMPAFGENITLHGACEADVRIGDTFRLGQAIVQLSQPRYPCFKPGAHHREPRLTKAMMDWKLTGWYFRVLEPGSVESDASLELIEAHPMNVTVSDANLVMHENQRDTDGIHRVLAVPELSPEWQKAMRYLLEQAASPQP